MPNPILDAIMRSQFPPYGAYASAQDLGRIVVNPNQAKQQPMPMESTMPQQQVQQPTIPQSVPQGVQQQGGGNNFLRSILPLLPSLAAVVAGTASKNMLPGAAGFSQGYGNQYAAGLKDQQDRNMKLEEFSYRENKDTQNRKDDRKKFAASIAKSIRERGAFGETKDITPKDFRELADEVEKEYFGSESESSIVIVEKDGQQFELPSSQLTDALQQGYTQVK